MAQDPDFDCASSCRRMARQTCELAEGVQAPEIVGEYFRIAATLIQCAERREAGEPYSPGPGRTDAAPDLVEVVAAAPAHQRAEFLTLMSRLNLAARRRRRPH
jgi:hypothetical protein